jgi:hypothetical protein
MERIILLKGTQMLILFLDPTADSLNMAVINDPKFKKREEGSEKLSLPIMEKVKNEGD